MRWIGAIFLALAACGAPASAPPGAAGAFVLSQLDGAAFGASATIRFPEPGRVAGVAPCNTYAGRLSAPFPAFALEAVAMTERGCDNLPAEAAFFAALTSMTRADLTAGGLTLSNAAGRRMVFVAQP